MTFKCIGEKLQRPQDGPQTLEARMRAASCHDDDDDDRDDSDDDDDDDDRDDGDDDTHICDVLLDYKKIQEVIPHMTQNYLRQQMTQDSLATQSHPK